MKTAYDLNHVKSVSALVLLFNGENAGRMVANYSDNPNGYRVERATERSPRHDGKSWRLRL